MTSSSPDSRCWFAPALFYAAQLDGGDRYALLHLLWKDDNKLLG